MRAITLISFRTWRALMCALLLACLSPFALAQQSSAPPPKKEKPAQKPQDNTSPTQVNPAVKSPTEVEEGAEFQKAREEWFLEGRRLPDGSVGAGMRQKAFEHVDQMIQYQRQMGLLPPEGTPPPITNFPGPSFWTEIGPMPINTPGPGFFPFNGTPADSGRIAVMAVDPKNKDIAYVGAAAGGVWKTTDAGATWTPLTDTQPSLSTGSIAIDPTVTSCGASGPCQIIYVGTGEANFSADSYSGAGILKSTNGGLTWTQLGASVFVGPFTSSRLDGAAHIGALAVDPGNNQIILAGVWRLSSSALSGIWRSIDGGQTWGAAPILPNAAGNGIVFDPGGNGFVYAALGGSGSAAAAGVYRSADHGATWTKMTGTGFPTGSVGRIALDISASAPATLFALIANSSGASQLGLFTTTNANAGATGATPTWTPLSNTPDVCTASFGSQCFYDMIVKVGPTASTANVLYAGGSTGETNNSRALFRSTNGGATWASVANGVNGVGLHVDLHGLAFSSDGTRLYIGNDGGAWRTDDPAAAAGVGPNYTNLNSTLGITMTYPGHALNFSDENVMFLGTQDNGSQRYSGSKAWDLVTGGDGGQTAEDLRAPTVVYTTCQFICIFRSITDGSSPASFAFKTNGINPGDRVKFIAPITQDPNNAGVVYYGTFRVYQTTTFAEVWNPITGDLTGGGGAINAIAVAKSDSNTVYVGAGRSTSSVTTLSSRIWKITNALTPTPTVTEITGGNLPLRNVTSVAVDPNNASIVYLTYSGFSGFGGDTAGSVFRSADSGATWVDITGTGLTRLPNVPANDVLPDGGDPSVANAVFVATDVGVFRTADATQGAGTMWSPLLGSDPANHPLPNAIVFSLNARNRSRIGRASTSGRGTWILQDLNVPIPSNQPLLTSMRPSSAAAGSAAVMVTLDGANFTSNSKVQWEGLQTGVTTSFVSANQLTATLDPSLLTANNVGVHSVNVLEPSLATPNSDNLRFSVRGGAPTVTSLSPTSVRAGAAAFNLQVNGTGFNCSTQQGVGTVILFRGVSHPALTSPPCSATSLTIAIAAGEIATGGNGNVTAFTPPPAGGSSNVFSFPIIVPPPPNDNFANAITAAPPFQFTDVQNSSGATTETGEPPLLSACNFGPSASTHSIWYKFTPTVSGTISADTNGTVYDSVFIAATGSLGSFTTVTCADNNFAGVGESLSFAATAGTTYFFVIDDFDGNGGSTTFHLTGPAGSGPIPAFTPASVAFGQVGINGSSAVTNVQLTNNGTAQLNVTSITLTGTDASQFALVAPTSGSPVCSFTLNNIAVGNSCFFGAQFKPTSTTGFKAANASVASNAQGSPHAVPLAGEATAAAPTGTLSFNPPGPIDFGSVAVGNTSAVMTTVLTNAGPGSVTLTNIVVGGNNPNDFVGATPAAGDCGNPVTVLNGSAPGNTCNLRGSFAPTATGLRTATITVTATNSTNSPVLNLQGTGTAGSVSLSPSPLNFGNQRVSTTSGVQNVTVTNNGGAAVHLAAANAVTLTGGNAGDFSIDGPSTTCTNSLTLNAAPGPGNTCNVGLKFGPTATGARTTTLTIADDAPGNPHTDTINGTGTAPATTFNPTNVAFGNQKVGTTSAATHLHLTNSGTATLNVTSIALTGTDVGQFTLTSAADGATPACPLGASALGAGNTCNVDAKFAPTTTGAKSASISYTDDATGSPQTVPLTGTGTQPAVTLSPTNVAFGNLLVGTQSAATHVHLTNSGTGSLSITSIALTGADVGHFALTSAADGATPACPLGASALGAGNTCNVDAKFAPTTTGAKSASISYTDDAAGSPQTVPLTGTGVQPAIGFSPTAVNFNQVVVGSSSPATHVHISNNGTSTLNITIIALTGADAAQFNLTSAADGATPACPLGASPLAAGNTCNVDAKFAPTTTGAKNANFSVTDDAPASPQTVPLTGTGTASSVVFNPSSVPFGNQRTGTTSAATHVHITNGGTATLNITSIALTGPDLAQFTLTSAADGATPACPLGASSLAATNTCNVDAKFAPTSTGAKSASMTVTDDAAGSPHSASLTGTGIAPAVTLNPTSFNFGSVLAGQQSAVTNMQVTNSGTDMLNFTGGGAAAFTLTGPNLTEFAFAAPTAGTDCRTIASLPAAASCNAGAKFTPLLAGPAGAKSASINIADDAATSPQQVPLSGTSLFQPAVSFDRATIPFGNQRVGTQSAVQDVVLTNTGNTTLNLTSITLTGTDAAQFALAAPITGTDCRTLAIVAAGANCRIGSRFAPTSTGLKNASISVADDAPGSPQTVALSGTGIAPATTFSPTTVPFGTQKVGTTSAATHVHLTNSGTDTLNITSIALTGTDPGQFTLTSVADGATPACPLGASALAAGSTCNVDGKFAPATTGAKSANISFTDDATGSPQTVPLTGTGAVPSAPTFSPTTVPFGTQKVGTTSAVTNVSITNNGPVALAITSIGKSGADAAQFNLVTPTSGTPCPSGASTLNAGASCNAGVSFSPTSTGAKAASLDVTDDAGGAPGAVQSVALTGTGAVPSAPTFNPTTVPFGNQQVGATSAVTNVSITNNGPVALAITSIGKSGADAAQFNLVAPTSGTPCPTGASTLNAGASCNAGVSFSPTSTGAKAASIVVTDDASGSPHTVSLTGTGVDFTLPLQSGTATVTAGSPATFTINVTISGGPTTNAITFSAAGNPAATTVTFNPATIPAGTPVGNASTTMTITTTARTAVPPQSPARPLGPQRIPVLLWTLAALLALASVGLLRQGARTRRWAVYLPLALLALGLAGVMGCSEAKPAGTPAGTSTITVTATSSGVPRTTTVTLTVN